MKGRFSKFRSISQTKTLYHCSNRKFKKFSLDHVGEGVGTLYYGPGIYLSDNKDMAGSYFSKYVYTVEMKDFRPLDLLEVDLSKGILFFQKLGVQINDKMLKKFSQFSFKELMMRYGPEMAQSKSLVWNKESKKFEEKTFKSSVSSKVMARKINRAFEELFGANCIFSSDDDKAMPYGICVYDPNLLKIISVEDNPFAKKMLEIDIGDEYSFKSEDGNTYCSAIEAEISSAVHRATVSSELDKSYFEALDWFGVGKDENDNRFIFICDKDFKGLLLAISKELKKLGWTCDPIKEPGKHIGKHFYAKKV